MSNRLHEDYINQHQKTGRSQVFPFVFLLCALVAIVTCITLAFALLGMQTAPVDSNPAVLTAVDPALLSQDEPAEPKVATPYVPPDPNAPRIYLTFDDGPSATSTLQILEILDEYGVKATFFMQGVQVSKHPDTVRLIDSKGHVIGNHSYSHKYEDIYKSTNAFMKDLNKCDALLAETLGREPVRIMRFPAGSMAVQLEKTPSRRNAIKKKLEEDGWRYFDWNASLEDTVYSDPIRGFLGLRLVRSIDKKVELGFTDIVVLAHDTDACPWTVDALPMVILYCQSKGYNITVLGMDSPGVAYR